ncbi:hypothetical protein OTU49_008132 [Cherax quadricarinatus]|uniref:DNA mismatch repair protein n=2 Tax=Cherax quadricarinatus TaxID=27406 RepID=A0AAW0WDE9_CHEQU
MSKQPSIFKFFSKSPSQNKSQNKKTTKENVKLSGNDITPLDMVWAKMDGYPWWPALVCENPQEKSFLRNGLIHVQFFDNPPTRGWVKEAFVKPYCVPGQNGMPTYKDPAWLNAVEEAKGAEQLSREDRSMLIVKMMPSDDEAMEDDDDDTDKSKENIDLNISKIKNKKAGNGEPEPKRRRIILHSDTESEDEYKPGKDDVESDNESLSSAVDENEVSEIETASEVDSPIKAPANKRKKPALPKGRNLNSSLLSSPLASKSPAPTPSRGTSKLLEGTKSKLSMFAAKETPSQVQESSEDWPFLKYPWLQPENIRDREKRSPDHPEYNPRTLYVPESFLNQQTPALRQWWDIKSQHYDTVLFFKMGKFYELFNMDATLGVQELGLIMMKGEKAHVGFPEIAYGRYSSTLIEKGYKVARIEQTETPDMMEKRCKNLSRPTKFDRVVRREVCQVSSRGTRVYSFLDGEAAETSTSYLLALTERPVRGSGEGCEFGVAFVDTSIGVFHVGQFTDDRHVSRLCTLMAHYPPAQILFERGRLSQKTQKLVNSAVPPNLRENLAPEKEFWTSSKTLGFLAEGSYFKDEGGDSTVQWPKQLRKMIDDGNSLGTTARSKYELAVSALGALTWYLMDCRLEEQLLTMCNFELYKPLDVATLTENEKNSSVPAFIKRRHHMVLDGTTLRNLEAFENTNGGVEGTLIDKLDRCSTPFGKRLLRKWICAPLCSPSSINSRLDGIEDLQNNPDIMEEVTTLLKSLPDLERVLARIHTQGLNRNNSSHPDSRAIFFEDVKYNKKKVTDFLAGLNGFKTTLQIIKAFKGIKTSLKSKLLHKCITNTKEGGNFPHLSDALKFFDNAFDHEEAQKEGKIIPSPGVDTEYDEAVEHIKKTKDELSDYLEEQCRHFGAKVVYWGSDKKRYQLEVPEHVSKKAGDSYELQGQKKGYKRFWTPTTKKLLADMISGEEHRDAALNDISRRIFHQFDEHHKKWEAVVQCLSVLDVLISLTCYAKEVSTVRPNVVMPEEKVQPFLEIRDGLHPCVTATFSGDEFIPNDVVMGGTSEDAHSNLVLVTGPNMGGKSTLMRQTALICILAQLGSFVPARSCQLTPIDRVFTRLGASDRIMMGESTFFVELAETSSIIQHSTQHSLVLVDELGRGTATYDGTAIASAVVKAIVQLKCRTLFSTHYHSLVDDFANVKYVSLGHMACMVEGENEDDPSQETITFLYKFTKGACPKSYGFNAARLAELPDEVIRRGSQKAQDFEKSNIKKQAFSKIFSTNCEPENLRNSIQKIRNLE